MPPVEDLTVTSVHPCRAAGFRVVTEEGETIESHTVALAVGVMPFLHYPPELLGLPPELVTHSSSHRDLAPFAGKDVTVLGGGQAAMETAALLAEHGAETRVVARAPGLNWNTVPLPTDRGLWQSVRHPHSGLGSGWTTWAWSELPRTFHRLPAATRRRIARSALGPAGAWWLRERFESQVPLQLGHQPRRASAEGSRLRLEFTTSDAARSSSNLLTDHRVAATGFIPDLGRLGLLDRGCSSTCVPSAGRAGSPNSTRASNPHCPASSSPA
ncbi:NAD(P)-binding domain-containing protein [Streptomyces sp. CA-106131]|uniref:NAD(P)-binding domain-containing protein n=1 Tax=Streptomyces sp. CA-106131 TaxID=3240045 RepID=UPI003D89B394